MMIGMQTELMRLTSPAERMTAVLEYLKENHQQVFNPEVGRNIWTYSARELESCKRQHKEKMYNNPEFLQTGYLAVNVSGRCGWKLLPIVCYLEDHALITFLLEQGAHPKLGHESANFRQALEALFEEDQKPVDEAFITRMIEFVAQQPQLPNLYWLPTVL